MAVTSVFEASPMSACMVLFRRVGLQGATNAELAQALGITTEEFAQRYRDDSALVLAELASDLERQKRDHIRLYAQYSNPVDRLYGLINYSIQDLRLTDPRYLTDLSQHPTARQVLQDHLAIYSTPQLHQLLNDGIRQGLFRSDINIQLVTIILIQQVNLALTPGIFPVGSFQSAEIFRSIFLYYIRGLCTEQGARQAAEHFSRM